MIWRLHFIGSSSPPGNPKTFVYVENPSIYRFPPARFVCKSYTSGFDVNEITDLAASLKTLFTLVETRDLLYA